VAAMTDINCSILALLSRTSRLINPLIKLSFSLPASVGNVSRIPSLRMISDSG